LTLRTLDGNLFTFLTLLDLAGESDWRRERAGVYHGVRGSLRAAVVVQGGVLGAEPPLTVAALHRKEIQLVAGRP